MEKNGGLSDFKHGIIVGVMRVCQKERKYDISMDKSGLMMPEIRGE